MIAIIDYGMGNLPSVLNSLESLNIEAQITDQPADIHKADGLILPGVGAFGDGMHNLSDRQLVDVLNEEVLVREKPILCICLGQQLIATDGSEFGHHQGLWWIEGSVNKIEPPAPAFKIPHMGWNNVTIKRQEPLFEGIEGDPVFYFVHSYHIEPRGIYEDCVSATCFHGITFAASLQYKNIFAVQFHPEKSQKDGLHLLKNFGRLL